MHLGKENKEERNRRSGGNERIASKMCEEEAGWRRIVFLYVVLAGQEFALYTKPSYNL